MSRRVNAKILANKTTRMRSNKGRFKAWTMLNWGRQFDKPHGRFGKLWEVRTGWAAKTGRLLGDGQYLRVRAAAIGEKMP